MKLAEFEWTQQVVAQIQSSGEVVVYCQRVLRVSASSGLVAGWWVGGYCSDLLKKVRKKKFAERKRGGHIPPADEPAVGPEVVEVATVGLSVGNSNWI